jgi:integrative and conjugative element protein (TIGR02256 family)
MSAALRLMSSDGTLQVVIENDSLQHWYQHRQTRFWHHEAGGLLFAQSVGSVNGCVHITTVTGPYPGDRRTRCSLILDPERCRADIEIQFSRGLHFVGYWHTHPEPTPTLSEVDRKAFLEIHRNGGLAIERFIAVVVGNRSCNNSLGVYLVEPNRLTRLVCNSGRG